jgi:hypothetical protein
VWGGFVRTLLGSAHGPQPLSPVKPGLGPSIHGFSNVCTSQLSPAWCLAEIPGGFRVDDASGKRLGYFYWWDDPNALHSLDDVLTVDEARRMSEEFANLPEL